MKSNINIDNSIGKLEEKDVENKLIKVIKEDSKIVIIISIPHMIEIRDEESKEVEIIRLLKLTDLSGRKLFTQAEVGNLFGLSRQMINRRWVTFNNDGFSSLLSHEYDKSKLSPEVMKRITKLVSSNWHLTNSQIATMLIEEGLVKYITPNCVGIGIKKIDGTYLRNLMRERRCKGEVEGKVSRDYVIERLFEIIKEGFEKGTIPKEGYQEIVEYVATDKENYQRKGKYKRNGYKERKYLERDKLRKEKALRRRIEGISDGGMICPDCESPYVVKKETRLRRYEDIDGNKIATETTRVYCENPNCSTKTFTVNPFFLEQWARVPRVVKKKTLRLIVHVRGSYRRVKDYLVEEKGIKKSWVSLLNWVRKIGAECIELEKLIKVCWSGKIVIDEKWVKLYRDWVYIYKAVDAQTGETLVQEVYPNKGKETAKAFLIKVKMLGYFPKVIVTDLCSDYDEPISEIFPSSIHHQCILHAERRANELMREYLPGNENKGYRDIVKPLLRKVFSAKDEQELEERYKELMSKEESLPEASKSIFSLIKRYYPKLHKCIVEVGIPKTTNACENAIKGFDLKYQNTFGYSNIYAIRDFLKLSTIYERLGFRSSGRYKGMSPHQVMNGDIGMGWVEWLMIDWVEDSDSLSPPNKNRLKMSNEGKRLKNEVKMTKSP